MPEERKAFLRQWWDGAGDRMYENYREQVVGLSNEELVRNREAYEAMIGSEAASVTYLDMLRNAAARGVGRSEGNKDIER